MRKATIIDGYYKHRHPLYNTHKRMLSRCYNPNEKHYKYYGGRGIQVIKRWRGPLGFQHFVKDMGPRPEGRTVERINNNGWYSPTNCKWETMSTQSLNRRMPSTNSSGYPGIHLFKATNKWSAYIDFHGRRKHLGYFDNLHDAIETRRCAEEERRQQ